MVKVRFLVRDTFTAVGIIKVDFESGDMVLSNSSLPAFEKLKQPTTADRRCL